MDQSGTSLLFIIVTHCLVAEYASGTANVGTVCHPAKTCGNCMTINPVCSWCKDVNTTFTGRRCDILANLEINGCVNVVQATSTIKKLLDKDLRDQVYSQKDEIIEEAVPIAPQNVNLNLRLGDTKVIDVRVLQVNDYPVDVYFLMDMSRSMEDDLENLKNLGSKLAKEMKNITRSFALGFGSFIDKPVAPFISIAPNKINSPCPGCQKAYSFRNQLSLNQNTTLFEEKVKATKISSNLDEAEGTLDAVMQAAVCKEEIGWRDNARKLLVISSDAPFHIEGDGRLAGIMAPNDGNCHLKENEYTDAHLYDYPSLGQLNEKLIENNVIPIFAISVTDVIRNLYEEVKRILQGAVFSELRSDSSNIVEILSDKYKEITGSIELAHSAMDGVELRISSDCREGSDPVEPGDQPICNNVHDGDEISFQVEVKATRCMDQTFDIYPIGFNKRLTVQVNVSCNCSCDFEPEFNSSHCSVGNGDRVCGICQCHQGRYGDTCECAGDGEETEDQSQKDIYCKPDEETKVLCSGRGECICGQCRCRQRAGVDEIVSGTYCECNNKACPRDDGEVCGGSERGECVCAADGRTNECRCRPGYTGAKCNCPTQTDTCRARNGLICNAAGRCVCGKCVCDKNTKFSGPRCDECLTCTDCDLHIDCVKCKLFHDTGSLSTEECDMCSQIIKNVTELPKRNSTESACSFSDQDGCSISFAYKRAPNGSVVIYVKGDRDCAHSETISIGVKVHLLIVYIIFGTILCGLILVLLYRFYTWHVDVIEYKQFVKEQKTKTKWSKAPNPIYEPSSVTVQNPTFGRESMYTS